MPRVIRLQSDSNAHDRPWRVAVEQGFFADEGLTVEYHEDNPKGAAGRVENFSERWKESQLQQGALEVYPVCEWGAIERVQSLGKGRIIGDQQVIQGPEHLDDLLGRVLILEPSRRGGRPCRRCQIAHALCHGRPLHVANCNCCQGYYSLLCLKQEEKPHQVKYQDSRPVSGDNGVDNHI